MMDIEILIQQLAVHLGIVVLFAPILWLAARPRNAEGREFPKSDARQILGRKSSNHSCLRCNRF